ALCDEASCNRAELGPQLVIGEGPRRLPAEIDDSQPVTRHIIGNEPQIANSLAHGVTITLPITSRSSIRRSASRACVREKTRSITGLRRPSEMSASSFSRSCRAQLWEPRTFSSNVQMKRKSSFGSKPAVAPQVKSLPPRFSARSEGTQVSPPVK